MRSRPFGQKEHGYNLVLFKEVTFCICEIAAVFNMEVYIVSYRHFHAERAVLSGKILIEIENINFNDRFVAKFHVSFFGGLVLDIDEICLFENIDVVGNRGCREGERLCNFQNVHGLFGKNS